MTEKLRNNEEEFRAEQSEKMVEFLDRSGTYEYFQDILAGKEDAPDFEKFKDFIVRINGIARDIPIAERKVDGVNVGLSGFVGDIVVPRHEDKEGLLRYAYESVKNIDKEDIKYMLPAVVNAVHLFNDGNGRTSRILHLLLCEHESKEIFLQEAKKALGRDGRFDSLDINPGLIDCELEQEVLKKHGWTFNEENPDGKLGKNNFYLAGSERMRLQNRTMPEKAKEFFDFCKTDQQRAVTAIYMLFGDNGVKKLFTDKYKKVNPEDLISPFKMLELLSQEEWQRLIDNFWQLKREEIEVLVDIFKNPEVYRTGFEGEPTTTIRDVFIEGIQKRGIFDSRV